MNKGISSNKILLKEAEDLGLDYQKLYTAGLDAARANPYCVTGAAAESFAKKYIKAAMRDKIKDIQMDAAK